MPKGDRKILVRRIGYVAFNYSVTVPRAPGNTRRFTMLKVPQMLAPVDVQVERKGIYGVVGDTAYHALPGTLVEVLGGAIADTTDAQGRFGFDGLRERHYVLRVSRVGYFGRLISVDHDAKGRDSSIFLTPYSTGSYDWANSREALIALPDLASRLATEPKRNRMTREDLERYGTAAVCDIPRVLLFAAAVANMRMIPHPVWFWIIGVAIYPVATWLGARLGGTPVKARS